MFYWFCESSLFVQIKQAQYTGWESQSHRFHHPSDWEIQSNIHPQIHFNPSFDQAESDTHPAAWFRHIYPLPLFIYLSLFFITFVSHSSFICFRSYNRFQTISTNRSHLWLIRFEPPTTIWVTQLPACNIWYQSLVLSQVHSILASFIFLAFVSSVNQKAIKTVFALLLFLRKEKQKRKSFLHLIHENLKKKSHIVFAFIPQLHFPF